MITTTSIIRTRDIPPFQGEGVEIALAIFTPSFVGQVIFVEAVAVCAGQTRCNFALFAGFDKPDAIHAAYNCTGYKFEHSMTANSFAEIRFSLRAGPTEGVAYIEDARITVNVYDKQPPSFKSAASN